MISLIICTYNRDKFIYQTLQHIADNNFDRSEFEIVLVNNNCTDNTDAECKRFANEHSDIDFRYFVETKQGLSHARNRGIDESRGDILVFLDDDAFVRGDYMQVLRRQMEQHPEAMAFGGKITPLFESGEEPAWLGKWTYSWVSAIDKGSSVVPFEGNSYPIGANMGFRKECIDACGKFNTELGRSKKNLMGGEEKDIFNRVKEKNYAILYFPDLEVQHVIPPQRTTKEYIKKMALGIGVSERLRTLRISKFSYLQRIVNEMVKWGGGCCYLSWIYAARTICERSCAVVFPILCNQRPSQQATGNINFFNSSIIRHHGLLIVMPFLFL